MSQRFSLAAGVVAGGIIAFVAVHIFATGHAFLLIGGLDQPEVRGLPAYAMGLAWLGASAVVLFACLISRGGGRALQLRAARNVSALVSGAAFLVAVVLEVLRVHSNVAF